ncbi:hypothetical protein NQ314_008043 [Rhamnusium bicolor]|uniref:DUF4218 domain-containing protein n=1 Tax=Rhamnusium bicolor TaxID=1586634 RepID=A0AAV8YFT4_9CUCU|nr:hypothetical protein NQ314_008043 [Rhamnusium bicolor]
MPQFLIEQATNIPLEFNRKPRSVNECKRWKATEFRQFFLYTGPVVLKSILSASRYSNFICLHVSITMLSRSNYKKYLEYSKNLLKYFIETFITLYGKEYTSHNIHNLIHLPADVNLFGPLD